MYHTVGSVYHKRGHVKTRSNSGRVVEERAVIAWKLRGIRLIHDSPKVSGDDRAGLHIGGKRTADPNMSRDVSKN
jgi:hypothetical protein